MTVDDIVDVVREEPGGHQTIRARSDGRAYLESRVGRCASARAVTVLLLGQLLTATARPTKRTNARAVVLALFIPLIISSGGNSGSQASTLVIRALAMEEVRLRDWWRVFLRELGTSFMLGSLLGVIGLLRVIWWPTRDSLYGEHFFLIGLTVAVSLVWIVVWGSIAGSMLPFLLQRMGFDPASASAPFVRTRRCTGLVIYSASRRSFSLGLL